MVSPPEASNDFLFTVIEPLWAAGLLFAAALLLCYLAVCFRVMASDERHITEVYCFVPQPAENEQEDAAQKKA